MHYPYIYRLQRYKKKLNYKRKSTLNMLKSISTINFHPSSQLFTHTFSTLQPFCLHPSTFKNEDQLHTLNIQTPNRNNSKNLYIGRSMGPSYKFPLSVLEITSIPPTPIRARTTHHGNYETARGSNRKESKGSLDVEKMGGTGGGREATMPHNENGGENSKMKNRDNG